MNGKQTKQQAAKVREAIKRAKREYCPLCPKGGELPACFECMLVRSKGTDCKGNRIGEREYQIAMARASVFELPPFVVYERKNEP
jgi:hypothetical protein